MKYYENERKVERKPKGIEDGNTSNADNKNNNARRSKDVMKKEENGQSDKFCVKGAVLLMYHKTMRNRHLKVVLDAEASVPECRRCLSLSNPKEQGSWMVPCDMTGLCEPVLSGAKPQRKPIRVRFHPETLRLAANNAELANCVDQSAKELVEQMLGGEWTATIPTLPDIRLQHISDLRNLFCKAVCYILWTANSILVSFVVEGFPDSLISSSVVSALSLKVESQQKDEKESASECDSQKVLLCFVRDHINETLFELEFADNQKRIWISSERKDHKIELDRLGFHLRLGRCSEDGTSLPVSICSRTSLRCCDKGGNFKEKMLMESQRRAEELQRKLDESLAVFQKQQKLGNCHSSSKTSKDDLHRPLAVLHQDENEAIIQISGAPRMSNVARAEVSCPLKRPLGPSSSAPLEVIVNGGCEQSSVIGDSLASSPAGSVDSGVSSLGSTNNSPSSSPTSSPVYTRCSPFLHYSQDPAMQQLRMRQRSTSECCTSVGLKGILKKTKPLVEYKGRFARSVSECQHSDEKEAIADMIAKNTLEEEDEENENFDCAPIAARKKRVSFSERLVQERSFRPNSSILGQKKKNQRKMKNKLKKKANEETLVDSDSQRRTDSETSYDERTEEEDNVENKTVDVEKADRAGEAIYQKVECKDTDVKPTKLRERTLRSSTGEENTVLFVEGESDGDIQAPSSPEKIWMRHLQRRAELHSTKGKCPLSNENACAVKAL